MYTNNPNMPKIRQEAAEFARKHGVRCSARHFGFEPSTVSKWVKKSRKIGYHPIPTKSSRPKHHPYELDDAIVEKIVAVRRRIKRTSEVVHKHLLNEGVVVSLSSVHRTLDRRGLLKKRSPYKRVHPHVHRPGIEKPGSLVELDTVHLMTGKKSRIYVMTLIDVYSRCVYAKCFERISSRASVDFLNEAQKQSVFDFEMIQTDHGPEFGKWFVERIRKNHRYSRLGKPNDNSHIERFNRTLQEECLDYFPRDINIINIKLREYLEYYNTKRLHMGIDYKTPVQLLQECFQGV